MKNWRNTDVIKGLTDNIHKLSDKGWKDAVHNLRDLRLIAQEEPLEPDTLDCHPLLREHFGEKLKAENEEAWREGHNRLYEYYKATAKELPDTLEEMAPLFAAVIHGCQAGRHQEVFWDYYNRIQRDPNVNYCCNQLGAFGADLSVISGFFDQIWYQPVSILREDDKAFLLSIAGFRLRALGRIKESEQPIQAALDMWIEAKNWVVAAVDAGNLSELMLTIGDVKRALGYAEQSVRTR